MSELRYNIATGDWVLVAPERARRPEDFREDARPSTHDRPSHREGCPFCPGGEDNTPGESLRYLNESGDWLVRSFPNRFPAVRKEMHNEQTGDRFHRKRNGHGLHEVLAESRLHNATLALQPVSEVELVLRAWRERFLSVARMPGIDHVVIFKNHGAAAGSSLEHPHSQIVGLPVIPSPVRGRMQVAWSHYRKYGRCVFCEVLTSELEDRDRVIESNADFVAFVPSQPTRPSPSGSYLAATITASGWSTIRRSALLPRCCKMCWRASTTVWATRITTWSSAQRILPGRAVTSFTGTSPSYRDWPSWPDLRWVRGCSSTARPPKGTRPRCASAPPYIGKVRDR
jgi:hypothetical protein